MVCWLEVGIYGSCKAPLCESVSAGLHLMRSSTGLYLAFIPYNVAFGILSVLLPLYIVDELRSSLTELGTMTSIATAASIPASVYLGRLPDKYGRSKPFIAMSFLGVSTVLLLMPLTRSMTVFMLLYVVMNLAKYVSGPSTSILIAESFERSQWGRAMARQSFVEGVAQAVGLSICSLGVNCLGYVTLLRVTGPLVFASFVSAMVAVHDPPLYVERLLGRFEGPIVDVETLSFSFQSRGVLAPSRRIMKFDAHPRMALFGFGTVCFAFAASNAFVPLPVYLRENLSASTVFAMYLLRSLFGTFSYLVFGRFVGSGVAMVKVAAVVRVVLVLLIPLAVSLPPPFSLFVVAALLGAVALSWSLYSLGGEVVKVANAKSGSLGVYDALSSVGSALGSFVGGSIPLLLGFGALYIVSSGMFALSALLFALGLR